MGGAALLMLLTFRAAYGYYREHYRRMADITVAA
jgi:hypothetical protein